MLKMQRLACLITLCAWSLTALGGCEKPPNKDSVPSEQVNGSSADDKPAADKPADGKPVYACPTISTSMVDGQNPPEHGLGLGILVPEGFTWSKQQAPEHGELIQIGRFELPFKTPTDKRHPERLAIIQVEQGPALDQAAAVPLPKETIPYVMGSGAEDEETAQAIAAGKGLLAGERELGGQKLPILRQPGAQSARFVVRMNEGGKVRDITVSVFAAKTYPVTVTDQKGAACIADFDRVALEVIKGLNPAS